MANAEDVVADNLKRSFLKVKEDINSLREELNNNKKEISEQNNILNNIKSKIELILSKNEENKANLSFFNSSIGNKGVINDQQRSASMINNDQQQTMPNNEQRSASEEQILDPTLTFRFKGLTDREFSIFLAIYEIERELGEATFTDLANKLNLSEPAIRNIVNRILSKQIPIKKDRFFNRKVLLSIKQEFRDPKIIRAILKLRQISTTQTTLFGL